MNLFGMLEVSGSALTAERQPAEVVTSNMANAETTRTPEGGPYRRNWWCFARSACRSFRVMLAGFGRGAARGVEVEQVVADPQAAHRALSAGASRCRCQRLCRVSGDRSGGGDGRPAGRGAGL